MKEVKRYISAAVVAALAMSLPQHVFGAETEAERRDSTAAAHITTLDEFEVTALSRRDIIPIQTLSGKALDALRNNSLADAMRYFSGVQIKDYGGVGGIKTINVRSMGTNHTAVNYDGLQLGNAQNGQIDLGQFSMDNLEAVDLYNGQKSRILQPARDFGSAAQVYLRTRRPHFQNDKDLNMRIKMRSGSFGLLNPVILTEYRFSPDINASVSAEWLRANGKYPFRYRKVLPGGAVAYDTTAVRQNGDIDALRAEANLYGLLRDGEWSAKAYLYNSERGIPGAIVNNVWRRGERIWDTNTFAQGRWQQTFGSYTTMANAKYAYYRTHYLNNDDKVLRIDNLFHQQEVYLSSANLFEVHPTLNLSASYDLTFNTMEADLYNFARPRRLTNMLSGAASWHLHGVSLQASLLWTHVHDRLLASSAQPSDRSVYTPTIIAAWQATPSLLLSAYYKESFRMPTFNDLYYTDMGNASLLPERVRQLCANTAWRYTAPDHLLSAAQITLSGYFNNVKDKIVAYPKGQQFRWTMVNLGRVHITGAEAATDLTLSPLSDLNLTLHLQYTYQQAIDVTDPSDSFYRHQIPYIPHHSGSLTSSLDWRGYNLHYSWIYVGPRWCQQENTRVNYLQPWYTSDLSLSKTFPIPHGMQLETAIDINNLLSQDYEVILNYPMPKRNYRFTLGLTF